MKGIQFLLDRNHEKIAAVVDLKQHAEFWQDILAEPDESANFHYLTNEQGLAIAIILDFATHAELWEDLYDNLLCDEVEQEERIPWTVIKQELAQKREIRV